ncbi:EamA family transporter RarD [Nitrogeniibacter mangrovi]|uniref:EamA family transporter RarD n=1 Tax=Nitrogeniibacter mangrovi TaxID=2016596 RepID=A0A6C1AZW8_9RHOO|nr:EamA family transporter RarD [Nitrogeniibacter mangrovi]QID16911.1 EamA family transporter RarD [Nitrogeniibacter mangrovi]
MTDDHRRGVVAATLAFVIWGLAPLYFKAVAAVPASQIVAHRVLWSVLFLALLLVLRRQWPAVRAAFADRRLLATLFVTAMLTGGNWLVFVWAVTHDRVLEGSLGYFINPLLSVLLGRLFLGERLRPWQRVAVAIAVAGVLWRVIAVGQVPFIALFLALTFGFYGLLRKRTPVDAISGLFVETVLVLPIALGWLLWQAHAGELFWGRDRAVEALLPLAGVLTATPLMLFAVGARRLPLATVGFLQYLAPSLNFLLAVFVFHETFDAPRLLGFVLIWIALAIYSVDLARAARPR